MYPNWMLLAVILWCKTGLIRSSDETSVMEVERMGVPCPKLQIGQPEMGGTLRVTQNLDYWRT